MKSMVMSYQVLEPIISNAFHLDLEVKARKVSNKFSDNALHCFLAKCSTSKRRFEKELPI